MKPPQIDLLLKKKLIYKTNTFANNARVYIFKSKGKGFVQYVY